MVGGDHLVHLDELREDAGGAELRAVSEGPAPTTAGQLMRRLNARQCPAAVKELAKIGEDVDRQLGLMTTGPVTLDLDSFDSEVYGRLKQGAAFNYRGERSYDTQLATWAERRRILAAELRSGNLNEHPTAIKVVRRALKALPTAHGRVRARMDSGFESVAILEELRRRRVGFTCSLRRTPALHRLRLELPARAWRPPLQMPRGRDRGDHPYARGWQQEPLRLIVRRVRIPVEELSEDPRSRRRRTVPQAQLELALEGRVEYVYAYSFILTDLEGDAAEIEHWHRQRAQIEERVKEAELGDGLLHFPLGTLDANRVWQTARVTAHNLVALLSAVVADVNHHRLREQLEQSPEPPPRPAAARVANHNTKLVRRWLLACPGGSCTAAAGWCCGSPRACSGPRPSSPPASGCAGSPPAPERRGARVHHPRVHRHPRARASSRAATTCRNPRSRPWLSLDHPLAVPARGTSPSRRRLHGSAHTERCTSADTVARPPRLTRGFRSDGAIPQHFAHLARAELGNICRLNDDVARIRHHQFLG